MFVTKCYAVVVLQAARKLAIAEFDMDKTEARLEAAEM